MGPRTQAALNRYNAKTTPTPTPTTPVVAAQPKPAVTPAAVARPNPPVITTPTSVPATAVQSGSGSPIRTGSGGYLVSPDYSAASDSTSQSPYDHNLMLAAIKNRESGGDPNAVSRAGAVGTMQTMPNTLRDPGFGVKPARDNSPQELERVGKDYYAAMLKNYNNDPKVALAAYNWGPGNVNKWLKAGGDFSKLPGETRAYVKNIMGDYSTAQSTKVASGNRPPVSEAHPNQQIARYKPDGTTYRGTANKMPTLDPEDPAHNAIRFGPEHDSSYEQDFDKEGLKRVAAKAIASLPKIEQQIIKLHMWHGVSLDEIGKRLGVSKSRVRQIEEKALSKLRASSDLKSFAEQDSKKTMTNPQPTQGEWDAMVRRIGQRAKAGPMVTVRDPETGRTRNIPVKPKQS
jgi:RNA polymerase sigma factor (sigma-70 family)